jgi:Mn2+/Fe2+ NRAMP family transporter
MSVNKEEFSEQHKYKRAYKAKRILMIITYVTTALFLGLIIYMIVAFGIAATEHANFDAQADILSMYVGLPMFTITLLSGISIGIINLITGALDDEDTTKEFKLVGQEEEI